MAALTEEQLRWSQTTTQLGNVSKSLDAEFSDSVDLLDKAPKGVWIQTGGTLKVDLMGGTTIEIESVPDDTFIDWLRIKRIYATATGTEVSNVTGIY
jgi:hypothetical protein